MTKIAVFIGSLQKKSYNKMLAGALENLKPQDMEFIYVDINLPLFNQDLESAYPESARNVKNIVEAADGVLFITPEYNRSVPGVLKNAIDWASRPYGANSFAGKPVGMVGASIGPVGTAVAQSDLRHIVGFLDMKPLGQPEVYIANAMPLFSDSGELVDERWIKNLRQFIAAFDTWVKQNS
ncbi:MAG: NAD(P)H-dependent oxidoreductase [Candidatus Saccharibacteria bacterium]|nr:MAG: NAD(P)H-dependent oxidoreductase [Candidatus Saccharibacteria bacterium]